ncbi:MAG: DNA topoisomerase 4 subunit A [Lachnospiraceae bacterium]|nr:DNA topoisomerase 4 subunit A [Lachnospiraceae bacterium]
MDDKMITAGYSDTMRQSYLNYSMSVITARALPDIRDGLKPVQRRTLYAMHELALHYDRPHRKCARIVGDTMGKYHPHGDSSIYDALVVMSQDFKRNEPLADPHGNFGSIEGDGAAAMRYTEARLQKLTEMVYLADLDKDVVDFVPNFDETEKEPEVLPVRIPNILVNGAEGIAVGMTTNIPSHNLREVLACLKAYIDNPDISTEEMLKIMPGPDFATGGIIANQEVLPEIYETGVGKLRVRGKVEFEKGKSRERDKLVITEIPYTMIGDGIRKFLSDTAELAENRTLPEITDISNESSKEGIRIVLELKKGADIERIKNILYKKTKLEDTFGVNMIAIVNNKPCVLSLKDILRHHVEFQISVNQRKYTFLLNKELEKKEIQEGLIQAVDIIDLIIEIIRGSRTRQMAKACLMGDTTGVNFKHPESKEQAEKLTFTERQADAILDLRLAKLIGLEILALEKEHKETLSKIKLYQRILKSRKAMLEVVKKDLDGIMKEFGHERRTLITSLAEAVMVKEEVKEEDVLFLMDRFGYVKTVDLSMQEKQKDQVAEYRFSFVCKNIGKIQFFTSAGKMYQAKVKDIPFVKMKDKGVPIDNISKYDSSHEQILCAGALNENQDAVLLFLTAKGLIKQVPASEFQISTQVSNAARIAEGDELIYVDIVSKKQLILQSTKGNFLRFAIDDVKTAKKTALGVKGMQLEADAQVKNAWQISPSADKDFMVRDQAVPVARVKLGKPGGKGTRLKL